MKDDLRIKASDLMQDATMTIRVKLIRDWRFKLGLWLMKLGVKLMGMGVKIEQDLEGAA